MTLNPTMFQGIETPSSLSSLLEYDCWNLEKIMFRPVMFKKSSSGQFSYEIENVKHEYNVIEVEIPNTERLGYLHRKSCKSYSLIRGRSPRIHRIVAEELLNSVPLAELSYPRCIIGKSEGSRIGDVDIVNPINSTKLCTSSKLEVDEQMIVTQDKSEAVIQGCESLTEDVNGKIKEVSVHGSGGCKGHKENQLMDRTYKDRYHVDNPKKTLRESNNKALFLVRPRTEEGHLQSQGDMLNHLIKHSSTLKPDHKNEAYDRKKSICPSMENCKCLPDKGPEQFKRDKNPTSEKETTKFNCDQNINGKEKRETSMENRKRASSISNVSSQPRFLVDKYICVLLP